jgi:chromosome segregation ATPase
MRIDDLPEQLQAFADQARGVLDWEIRRASKAAEALNADRAAAEAALTGLKDQRATAQKQLDDTLANLNRGTTLAGLTAEISEARKTLKGLEADKAKAETSLEATQKKLKDTERELNEADGAMQRLRMERSEAVVAVDNIKALLKGVDLRRSA